MLTLAPLVKVKVYVHKDYLDKVLFRIGKEGMLHIVDLKEDFGEEVAKGILRPLDVSSRLYRISSLTLKIEKLASVLKLPSRYSLEDIEEEGIFSLSLPDIEAYVDALERMLSINDESTIERVRREHEEKVSKLRVSLKVLEALESIKTKIAETATVSVFSGWLPKELLKPFISIVERASSGYSVVKYEEPKFHLKVPTHEELEEEKYEIVNVRFYLPKDYVENVVYSLSRIKHSIVDLRDYIYTEFKENVKPLEPSPRLFKLSSLSSRLDVLLSTLNLHPPEDIRPLSEPLSDEKLNEIDATVSSVEKEVFYLHSRLESMKKSVEVVSRLESDISTIAIPQAQLAEVVIHGVKGSIKSIVLQLSDEVANVRAMLDRIKDEKGAELVELKKIVEGARIVEEKKLRMVATDNIAILQVAVAKEDLEKMVSLVKEASSNNFSYREVGRPTKVKVKKEVAAETPREVKIPSLMKNPRWSKVYESLVRGLGTLNYKEIDPTVIWFFTFPILFGIMFPDAGHGIVLLALSIPLYYLKKKGFKAGELANYIIQGAPILIAGSIASIFFGIIFGEFFGSPSTPGYPLPNIFDNAALNSFRTTVLKALGLSASHEFHVLEPEGAKALLKFSIHVAIFHIVLGLVISVINKVRLKEYKEAIVGPGLWLWLYVSAAIAFMTYGGGLIKVIFGDIFLSIIVLWLPFIVMIIARVICMGMLEGFSESLDSLIASLSNTISYARLFAFAIIHAVLSHVFLLVDGGLQKIAGIPFVGVVAGTLFFVFFEIIFVFLQALRLHWVEHGMKFLLIDGVPFQPFMIKP
ncbi:MAG: V-type ATPase 116kDa subunit family protein [Candidatus Nezhaarchaeales archaeon]